MQDPPRPNINAVYRDHSRQWRTCVYVYPVISRRGKGLSIGVNLNPDQDCTFSCLYCQVQRRPHRAMGPLRLEILQDELEMALEEAISGRLWNEQRFLATPTEMRRINDIAFSGDGEPTCVQDFDQAVAVAAEVKRRLGRKDIKLVVITNASMLDGEVFHRALPILDANNGEIWAKLDAGSEEFFREVNRPRGDLTLAKIVRNITDVSRGRPVVIQTLLFRWNGQPPAPQEITAYISRLREILDGRGHIRLVQLHTIARSPACPSATRLEDEALEAIASQLRSALPGLTVEVYGG